MIPLLNPAEVIELAAAMEMLLDDMGELGTSVCLYHKAKARIAYEPFRAFLEDDGVFIMGLDKAREVVAESER